MEFARHQQGEFWGLRTCSPHPRASADLTFLAAELSYVGSVPVLWVGSAGQLEAGDGRARGPGMQEKDKGVLSSLGQQAREKGVAQG